MLLLLLRLLLLLLLMMMIMQRQRAAATILRCRYILLLIACLTDVITVVLLQQQSLRDVRSPRNTYTSRSRHETACGVASTHRSVMIAERRARGEQSAQRLVLEGSQLSAANTWFVGLRPRVGRPPTDS